MERQKNNWKKVIYGVCVFIIAIWWLNSCHSSVQSPKSVTLYYGSFDYTEVDNLLDSGEYEEAVKLCIDELEEVSKDSDKEMQLLTLLGEIYGLNIEDRDQAIYYLEQAVAIARKNQNQSGLADACYCMSKVYVNLGGNVEKGLEYAKEAEKIYRNVFGENTIETADVLFDKGKLYLKNEEWENALKSFNEAEEIYELKQEAAGDICTYIGNTLVKLGDNLGAEGAFRKAQEQSEETGNEYQYALASLYLGKLYTEEGEYDKATANYDKALDFFETDKNYLRLAALVYNHLAYCAKNKSGKWEDGIGYAIKSCQAIEDTGVSIEEEKAELKEYKEILLESFYKKWKPEATDTEFDFWYQRVVLDGEDWEEE